MTRMLTPEDLAYDRIVDRWAFEMSGYDTTRRLQVLLTDFIDTDVVAGKSVLDAGCGLGHFAAALGAHKPKRLVCVDIAPKLVGHVSRLVPSAHCLVGDVLDLDACLGDEVFDVVVSSEVIEHTPDPRRAVAELCARVAPDGTLLLSCPNKRWRWLLSVAQSIGLRRIYEGYENWPDPNDLTDWIRGAGLGIVRKEGVHTLPWQCLPKPMLRSLDSTLRTVNYSFAVNLAIKGTRPR